MSSNWKMIAVTVLFTGFTNASWADQASEKALSDRIDLVEKQVASINRGFSIYGIVFIDDTNKSEPTFDCSQGISCSQYDKDRYLIKVDSMKGKKIQLILSDFVANGDWKDRPKGTHFISSAIQTENGTDFVVMAKQLDTSNTVDGQKHGFVGVVVGEF